MLFIHDGYDWFNMADCVKYQLQTGYNGMAIELLNYKLSKFVTTDQQKFLWAVSMDYSIE